MYRKPFRPPLLKRVAENNDIENITKKPRLETQHVPRRPLDNISNAVTATRDNEGHKAENGVETYYLVLWRKFTNKKNKTWDGDGVLKVVNGYATLLDVNGKEMGRTAYKLPLLPGSTLSMSGRELEVDSVISKAEFQASRAFLKGNSHAGSAAAVKPSKPLENGSKRPLLAKVGNTISASVKSELKAPLRQPVVNRQVAAPYKNPFLDVSKPTTITNRKVPTPKHDPLTNGALVMPRPSSAPHGKQLVDVVIDPILSRHLRDHQRVGVKFLYECVMGMRLSSGQGCILADEMGLGKTLQTITLIWTLLKQNPVFEDQPVIKKALIVCPVTLINNWRKEFRKWLGNDRIGVFVADDKHNRISNFTKGKAYNVMIVGYEKLRTIQDELAQGVGVDLVVCDEGHRLKTAKNKAILAINALNADRRIVLTGTPIQNDLSEFFIMADLVNPGALGKYNKFKKDFETPIVKGRQPGASRDDIEKGQACSDELAAVTSQFILRRTSDVIAKYLPPITETVLFCKPTDVQASIYRAVLRSQLFSAVLGSSEASFQLINILKKLCNSPSLFLNQAGDEVKNETIASLLESIPSSLNRPSPGSSTKMQLLDSLLHHLQAEKTEKIVIVSNYTSTLDMIQKLLTSLSYTYLRLDGTTPAAKRQGLVDQFNKASPSRSFAFLLSAKAGGTGLNLIGASRLVLFDVDWNPATDLQAMARIHRDGQKKPCFIYRLLVQGALDEKIYQRQIMKTGLADAVVDAKKTAQGFTMDELRDLFRLDESEKCPTHELLGCDCAGSGNAQVLPEHDESSEPANPWGSTMADPAADDADYDEDMPATQNSGFLSAASVNIEDPEKESGKLLQQSRGDKQMLALMQYLHIDAGRIKAGDEEVESLVEDLVLLRVLREPESRVKFLFARTTG